MFRKTIGLFSFGMFIVLKALFMVLAGFVIVGVVATMFAAGAIIQSTERIIEFLVECQTEFLSSIKEKNNGS